MDAKLGGGDRIPLSILDRLIDLEPMSTREAPGSRLGGVNELKQSIRRDLEWLLNTRRLVANVSETAEELKKSVVTYGIPDITGLNIQNTAAAADLTRAVEVAINTYEPRFLDVSVSLEPVTSTDRQVRFKIEARLDVDPVPEPMVFDTVLQLGNGAISVKER